MPPLFAISIQQPWLDLIVRGHKTLEMRDWAPKHRGLTALHASRTIDFPAAYFYGYRQPWKLPLGCLVAVVDVIDAVAIDAGSHADLLEQHCQPVPTRVGVYGVVFRDVRPLRSTIPLRGEPRFFLLDQRVTERVLAQISAKGAEERFPSNKDGRS